MDVSGRASCFQSFSRKLILIMGFMVLILWCSPLFGQIDSVYTRSYINKSTKFAWLTYGGDLNYLTGGVTQILVNGEKQDRAFGYTVMPRLTIGGIHFWGHADFYVSFPLAFLTLQDVPSGLDDIDVYQGVETGLRLYPVPLQEAKLSPFLGISFRRIRYSQEPAGDSDYSDVPEYGTIIYPLQFGLTYTSSKWHFTASGYYNFENEFNYFITPDQTARVRMDPLSLNISFLRYIDSDRHMRSQKAVQRINENYATLKNRNLLSAWFFGFGPSAVLQVSKSAYLKQNHPFLYDDYSADILPDITFGRYFHQPDLNLNLAYRTYGDSFEGFDTEIQTRRHSVGLESVKFLFNYLGFVPFAGPIVSYENLRTTVNGTVYRENKVAIGITFGWDIRVTKTGTSLLRTNLRYFPNLHMEVEGEKMMFDHLEFNFIQWVQFIGRKKALQ